MVGRFCTHFQHLHLVQGRLCYAPESHSPRGMVLMSSSMGLRLWALRHGQPTSRHIHSGLHLPGTFSISSIYKTENKRYTPQQSLYAKYQPKFSLLIEELLVGSWVCQNKPPCGLDKQKDVHFILEDRHFHVTVSEGAHLFDDHTILNVPDL